MHFIFGPKSLAVQTILSSLVLFLSMTVFAASQCFLSNGSFVPDGRFSPLRNPSENSVCYWHLERRKYFAHRLQQHIYFLNLSDNALTIRY
jgi:hypothetical protein